jgi:hypothetical protein
MGEGLLEPYYYAETVALCHRISTAITPLIQVACCRNLRIETFIVSYSPEVVGSYIELEVAEIQTA